MTKDDVESSSGSVTQLLVLFSRALGDKHSYQQDDALASPPDNSSQRRERERHTINCAQAKSLIRLGGFAEFYDVLFLQPRGCTAKTPKRKV